MVKFESPSRLVDRQIDAESISRQLIKTKSDIAVLFGDHGSGKTTLVRKWLMPILGLERSVFYGNIESRLPETVCNDSETVSLTEAISQSAIIFLDNLEDLFSPGKANGIELFREFLRQRSQTKYNSLIVFIVDADHLSKVYEMARFAPEILNAMWEIDTVDVVSGFRTQTASGQNIVDEQLTTPLAVHLSEELKELNEHIGPLSPALLEIVTNEYERLAEDSAPDAGLKNYLSNWVDIKGLLRGYVANCIADAFPDGQAEQREIVHRLLEHLALHQHKGVTREPVLNQLSQRLAVAPEQVEMVLDQLEQYALVIKQDSGNLELNPRELSWVQQPSAEDTTAAEWAKSLVEQGVNAWESTEALLPAVSFGVIHEQRIRISLTRQQIEYLSRCALWNEDIPQAAASYWCGRIADTEERIDLLRDGIHNKNGHVRARSARLMSIIDDIDIRNELYLRALKETDNNVRDAMIDSLAEMNRHGFKEILKGDVLDSNSPYRYAAIDCLRIFDDAETLEMLQKLWMDDSEHPELRKRAIRALAAMETEEAADKLLELRLTSNDDRSRKNFAETAIAEIKNDLLLDRIVMNLMAPMKFLKERNCEQKLGLGRKIWHAFLALVVVIFNVYLPGLALVTIRRWVIGGGLLLVSLIIASYMVVIQSSGLIDKSMLVFGFTIIAGTLFPTASLLRERHHKLVQGSSYRNILTFLLFLLSCLAFFLFHGLAHAFVRRWKVAFILLGLQIVGIAFIFIGFTHEAVIYKAGLAKELISWVPTACLLLGLGLFILTFVWDIGFIAVVHVLWAKRFEVNRRADESLSYLVGNKEITDRYFSEIARNVGNSEQLARKKLLLHKYSRDLNADSVHAVLVEEHALTLPIVFRSLHLNKASELIHLIEPAIKTLSQSTRDNIFKIVTRYPTELGLDVLDNRTNRMSWTERALSWFARRRVELRPLLNSVVVTLIVGSPFLFLSYEGIRVLTDPDWAIGKYVLRKEGFFNSEQRLAAAGFLARDRNNIIWLEAVLDQTSNPALKSTIISNLYEKHQILSSDGVGTVLRGLDPDQDDHTRRVSVLALSTIIKQEGFRLSEGYEEFRKNIGELVHIGPDIVVDDSNSNDEKEFAMQVVEFLATVIAEQSPDSEASITPDQIDALAEGLVEIILQQSLQPAGQNKYQPTVRNVTIAANGKSNFQMRALAKLFEIPGSDDQLARIKNEDKVDPKIRDLAKSQLQANVSDSLPELEMQLAQREHRQVITRSTRLLDERTDKNFVMEVLRIRATAYSELAFEDPTSRSDLLQKALADWDKYKAIGTETHTLSDELLVETDRRIVDQRVELGESLRDNGLAMDALKVISEAIDLAKSYESSLDERLAYASYVRAEIQAYDLAEYDRALESLQTAMEIWGDYAYPYFTQSYIFQKQGLVNEAAAAASKSIRLDRSLFQGYQLLLDAYLADETTPERTEEAIEKFKALKGEFADSDIFLPSYYLATIYHENLALSDPNGYALAFAENDELLVKFKDSESVFMANWIEASFTNAHYQEVIKRGTEYLVDPYIDAETRVAVRYFIYLANISAGSVLPARDALNSLQEEIELHTIDMSGWALLGTNNYIQKCSKADLDKLPEGEKRRLNDFIQKCSKAGLGTLSKGDRNVLEALGNSLLSSDPAKMNSAIGENFNMLGTKLKAKRFIPLGSKG